MHTGMVGRASKHWSLQTISLFIYPMKAEKESIMTKILGHISCKQVHSAAAVRLDVISPGVVCWVNHSA